MKLYVFFEYVSMMSLSAEILGGSKQMVQLQAISQTAQPLLAKAGAAWHGGPRDGVCLFVELLANPLEHGGLYTCQSLVVACCPTLLSSKSSIF